MKPSPSIHDGWTPQPHMQEQPTDAETSPQLKPEMDMTDDPAYHAWIESMAKHCRCSHNCPCDGVLAGGPCDDIQEHDNDDYDPKSEECPTCHGSGRYDDATPCPDCDGDGTLSW